MTMITLNWTAPQGSQIRGYQVKWKYDHHFMPEFRKDSARHLADTNKFGNFLWNDLGEHSTPPIAFDVDPRRPFTVKVRTVGMNGKESPWAVQTIMLVKPQDVPANCRNLKVAVSQQSKFKFQWEYSGDANLDKITRFEIAYQAQRKWLGKVLETTFMRKHVADVEKWETYALISPQQTEIKDVPATPGNSTGKQVFVYQDSETKTMKNVLGRNFNNPTGGNYHFRVCALNDRGIAGYWEYSNDEVNYHFFEEYQKFVQRYQELEQRFENIVKRYGNQINNTAPLATVKETRVLLEDISHFHKALKSYLLMHSEKLTDEQKKQLHDIYFNSMPSWVLILHHALTSNKRALLEFLTEHSFEEAA